MNRKHLIIAGSVAAVAIVGFYFASPLMAFNELKNAARDGNPDKLERLVDFPSVRDNLKSQLMASMNASMAADPEMKDNPFAGLAMMMLPAMVNGAVDAYVTPNAIAALVQGQKPAQGTSSAAPDGPAPDVKTSLGYSDVDTFRVRIDPPDSGALTMVMHRVGLFGWELKRIDLPSDLLKESKRPLR